MLSLFHRKPRANPGNAGLPGSSDEESYPDLPAEVLLQVFSYIDDVKSLCMASMVCKRWHELGNEAVLWEAMAKKYASGQLLWMHIEKDDTAAFKDCVQSSLMFHLGDICRDIDPAITEVPLKLVIVGDGATGKTSTLMTYVMKQFPDEFIPTVFDPYSMKILAGRLSIELVFWDTAGSEEYDRLRPLCYIGADVIILTFSLVNPNSFYNISNQWLSELRHYCPGPPIILGGTKMDLLTDETTLAKLRESHQRPVAFREAQKLARELKLTCFVPYSSRTQENLSLVIEQATRAGLAYHLYGEQAQKHGKCILN